MRNTKEMKWTGCTETGRSIYDTKKWDLKPCHYTFGLFSLASSLLFLVIGGLVLFAETRPAALFFLWLFLLLCQGLSYAACTQLDERRGARFKEVMEQSLFLSSAKRIQRAAFLGCSILFLLDLAGLTGRF